MYVDARVVHPHVDAAEALERPPDELHRVFVHDISRHGKRVAACGNAFFGDGLQRI